MGTNYYLVCGEGREHIGKASGRCAFVFHTGPGLPRSFKEWRKRLRFGAITDGGEETLSVEDFETMVEQKRDERVLAADFLDEEGHPFLEGEFS